MLMLPGPTPKLGRRRPVALALSLTVLAARVDEDGDAEGQQGAAGDRQGDADRLGAPQLGALGLPVIDWSPGMLL